MMKLSTSPAALCLFGFQDFQGIFHPKATAFFLGGGKVSKIYEYICMFLNIYILPELTKHLKMGLPKRKVVFQSSIFRCCVSFSEGTYTIVLLLMRNPAPVEVGIEYPIIYEVLYIPGGCLGFQPSTVCIINLNNSK